MAAPREILDRVARFEQQLDAFKSGQYNETQLRREFLDPFFKALGWDIDNEQGCAEAYKDVVHEDAIRMGSATKAPDYCFRIGGTRKFFLEAKKPSVDIKQDISPAHQLRSYAWSAKLPLSILSDFEELAVYDCRIKPQKDDKASIGRIFYCTFRDYAEKWDWIVSIFSREAVLKGSFDKFAESSKGKRGTTEVDAAFLAEIEGWRKEIAQNLALRNPKLTQRELNFAVQRIIDRIIFLRICEDRGIEDYGRLRALVNGERIYPRLTKLFEDADARYNSGLFHFKKEPERHEDPDELTLSLDIDDKLLREILRGLYYPECPYQFSVLSADILGQVYEQFLGTVIRLTEGHHAVPELKPEVRKAGGVYYTPTYIVDYIVRQTVGKLVEGKTPKQVEKIRILDPACGSGSFLIGAYQFLLDWHLQFYLANSPVKWAKGGKPALVQAGKGWKLTIAERKRILLANIYGVDIDTQAVEVTKLSLLLKVLEGETGQTLQTIFRLFQERALPDLGDNIKCGNSLIGPDFYQQGELPLLTDDEKYRINVFDWHAEFSQIFRRRTAGGELRDAPPPLDYTMPGVPLHGSYSYKKMKGEKAAPPPSPVEPEWEGGFDVVIGNPPYIRMEAFKELKSYLQAMYRTHAERADIFFYFIEAAGRLVRRDGRVGFILSNTFTRSESGGVLREFISSRFRIETLVEFGDFLPFSGATVYPIITILNRQDSKNRSATVDFVLQGSEPSSAQAGFNNITRIASSRFGKNEWTFEDEASRHLRERLLNNFPCLRKIHGPVNMGIKTGLNEAFIIDGPTRRKIIAKNKVAAEVIKPYLGGRNLDRYRAEGEGQFLIYTPHGVDMRTYPAVLDHLSQFRKELSNRATRQEWFELQQPQEAFQKHFDGTKIIYPDMSRYPKFSLDESGAYFSNTVYFIGSDSKFLLGLLNSKLLWFVIQGLSNALRGGLWRFRLFSGHVERLPMPKPDSSHSNKASHDRMVKLVEQMLELHPKLAGARTPQEKTALERQIAATDTQIDRLVYELYGLTGDEIKIVESTAK